MAKTKKTASRTRNWTFIHYPNKMVSLDVAQSLLKESLCHIGIPCAYQLHDKDTLEDGTKKPIHWHVVVSYSSVKSLEQVKSDFWQLAANGYIEPVRDMRAAVRYLSHMDNAEKAQYDEPKALNGLDISKHIASTDKEKDAIKAMKDIITYIRLNDIMYYNDLLDMLDQDGADELYKAAISRKLITPILAYLKAMDTQRTRQARAALDALQ